MAPGKAPSTNIAEGMDKTPVAKMAVYMQQEPVRMRIPREGKGGVIVAIVVVMKTYLSGR